MGITILLVVANALIVIWGFYFRGYMNKKGENLATKDDFKDLKAQTAELRQTTKEIEAKIDDQVWNRQRQWELKKETIIEVVRTTGKAEYRMKHAVVELETKLKNGDLGSAEERGKFGKQLDECIEYIVTFDGLHLMMGLIVDAETLNAFTAMKEAYFECVMCINASNFEGWRARNNIKAFATAVATFQALARMEMGIPLRFNDARPLSSGSSAAQGPDSQVPG